MQRFEQSTRLFSSGAPVGVVRAGEVFEVVATNAFGNRVHDPQGFTALMQDPTRSQRHHACVGPIEVSGAARDASLAVRIRKIEPRNLLSCVSSSTGTLAGSFARRECTFAPIERSGRALLVGSIEARACPSVGVVATADEQQRSLGRCSAVGGNLDIPLLQAGSTVFLPVNATRAQLAIGDVHFRQGAGELPGMGLESDALVELEVDFCEKFPFPIVENAQCVAIVGWGDDFLSASRCATHNALAYLARLPGLRGFSQAKIYQLLGGCDLIAGNLTGRVATCAVALARSAFVHARTGAPVARAPARNARLASEPSDQQILLDARRRYSALPVIHRGQSREIRALPDHPGLLVARLLDRVYSHEARDYVAVPGTARSRAFINGILSRALARDGVETCTRATSGCYVLISAEDVADRIEVVVKSSLVGDPRHRYPEMKDAPTRSGRELDPADHAPYVRFDWRRELPHADVLLPAELADYFIDVTRAGATALAAFQSLRTRLAAFDLQLPDVCFFMNKVGDRICGEVSPDNMSRISYVGDDARLRAAINGRNKRELARAWSAIAALLTQPHEGSAEVTRSPSVSRHEAGRPA